ncbi:MAG: hypothetical protein COA42_11540 [Alteromonadaceae bacterium]|nr:MAG: hypothetical protein COA42_11540 [Alteromonadaceae bacterium]
MRIRGYATSVGADPSACAGCGNNGLLTYDEPDEHLTRWYCLDKYGNRFPQNSNNFIEAVRIIVPSRFESVTTDLLGAPVVRN